MVRDFLEYRPYTAIAQFCKEIGQYVDDKEVARSSGDTAVLG